MARFEFKLPDIGEGVSEGEVVAWHVREGDRVVEDQPMVDVMTDKATVSIGSPKTGKISALQASVGSTVQVGDILVVIETGNGAHASQQPAQRPARPTSQPSQQAAAGAEKRRSASQAPAATAVGDIRDSLPGTQQFARSHQSIRDRNGPSAAASGQRTHGDGYFEPKPLATPATRKLARDLEVDLRRVPPSGPSGRVTKEDIQAYAGGIGSPTLRPSYGGDSRVPPAREDERVPFVGLRRRIAERMQASKNTAAHFTFVEECDVGHLKELRARLQPTAQQVGVTLNYLPFVIRAVVAALREHPMLNSSLDVERNELVKHGRYHIGVATATEQGLVVPVIRDADRLGLLDLSREVQRLSDGARNGDLSAQELSGSTFTITSLGKQSGLFATPVLNPPEVGILGVHRIKEKPVVRDGQIAIGQIMLLSLSFDHRIVDGHVGAAFAYEVIRYLETPELLML